MLSVFSSDYCQFYFRLDNEISLYWFLSKVNYKLFKDVDVIFTSLPNGESQKIANNLLKNNISTLLHIVIVLAVAIVIGFSLGLLSQWLSNKLKKKDK